MKKSQIELLPIPLIEVLDYEQPNSYIIETPIKEEKGLFPVLTANKSFIKGYTNETKGVYNDVPVIIFDDFTADYKYVDFPFKVKSSAMKFLTSKSENVNLKYVYYQMALVKVNTTTHKRYYISFYQNMNFLFPKNKDGSLNFKKQEEIVEQIETQFTRLDDSIKSLKFVKDKLKVYRKSVLKAAFTGNKWDWKELGNYSEVVVGYVGPISKEYTNDPNDISLLSTKNIDISGVNLTKLTFINKDFHKKNKKSQVFPGDILVARHGESGLSAVIPDDIKEAHALNVIIIKKSKTISSKYLSFLLNSKILDKINSSKTGSVQKIINTKVIKDLVIPVASVKEQEELIESIESSYSIIDKLEQTVDASLDKAELLRKSILKSAFEGKLVITND